MPNTLMIQLYRNMGFSRTRATLYTLTSRLYYRKLTRRVNQM